MKLKRLSLVKCIRCGKHFMKHLHSEFVTNDLSSLSGSQVLQSQVLEEDWNLIQEEEFAFSEDDWALFGALPSREEVEAASQDVFDSLRRYFYIAAVRTYQDKLCVPYRLEYHTSEPCSESACLYRRLNVGGKNVVV